MLLALSVALLLLARKVIRKLFGRGQATSPDAANTPAGDGT